MWTIVAGIGVYCYMKTPVGDAPLFDADVVIALF